VKAESLLVSELVSLKATANLIGNIETGKIAIEPGAEFSGNCKMRNNRPAAPQPAPQPERK
jgi:cytoskeletal protein CcmA (bactofilin family)